MAVRALCSSVRAWSRTGVRRASGDTYVSYEATTGLAVGTQRIKTMQKVFEVTGHEPDLYRHLPRDEALYKALMVFSVIGIGIALSSLYRMAAGTLPPKKRS